VVFPIFNARAHDNRGSSSQSSIKKCIAQVLLSWRTAIDYILYPGFNISWHVHKNKTAIYSQRQKLGPHIFSCGPSFYSFAQSLNSLFIDERHKNIVNNMDFDGSERPESAIRAIGVGGAEAVDCPYVPVVDCAIRKSAQTHTG
jgi:hypothetical protein